MAFNIKDEYTGMLQKLKDDVAFTNRLIYCFSTDNTDLIIDEVRKDERVFEFSKLFAILTLKDWLAQLRNKKYRHTVYSGSDPHIQQTYEHCQYQWFMLIDSPRPIGAEMVSHKIAFLSNLTYPDLDSIDEGLLTMYAILVKTSFAECYLRLLIESEISNV